MSVRTKFSEIIADTLFTNLQQSNKQLMAVDDFSNKEVEQIEEERRDRIQTIKRKKRIQSAVIDQKTTKKCLPKLKNSLIGK